MEYDNIIGVNAVAEMFGLSTQSVRLMCKSGELQPCERGPGEPRKFRLADAMFALTRRVANDFARLQAARTKYNFAIPFVDHTNIENPTIH